MAIAIVVGFVLCWVPWKIIESLMAFTGDSGFSCGFHIYRAIGWVIVDAYCAINPVICFAFSGNYRQDLKRLFKCSGAMRV